MKIKILLTMCDNIFTPQDAIDKLNLEKEPKVPFGDRDETQVD